ncbi:hypothetical protein GCM10022224_025670 [Nonomuraea antimicrobica]|uniref:Uncharacterized protein n=1 Tax=Nonomuraea antimicrobica TaxID=561173 RepID=A0ABP7BLD2_9ACTN
MSRSTSRYGRLAALTTAGALAAAWLVHPALNLTIGGLVIALGAIILASALFGSERLSEHAFRLLRWIADKSEPAPPG